MAASATSGLPRPMAAATRNWRTSWPRRRSTSSSSRYNMIDREAEPRLLPLAAERRLAVIINRPFQRGGLFDRFERHPLPPWAAEFDCANWRPVLPQVHRLPPGRHLCHPGDVQGRPHAREHGRGPGPPAGSRDPPAHDPIRGESLNRADHDGGDFLFVNIRYRPQPTSALGLPSDFDGRPCCCGCAVGMWGTRVSELSTYPRPAAANFLHLQVAVAGAVRSITSAHTGRPIENPSLMA